MPVSHIARALREQSPDFVVLAPGYPKATSNGGEFIRTRVRAYVAAGLTGHVFDYRASSEAEPFTFNDGTTPVSVVSEEGVGVLLETIADMGIPVLAHSPNPSMSELLRLRIQGRQLAVWYHGYEVRDYRRLMCNLLPRRTPLAKPTLDKVNAGRFAAARPVFQDEEITKVFVSNFQRRYSEWDVGAEALNSHVIPNHIDTTLYQARVRRPEESRNILLMRSFNARNYANDVALRALEHLAPRRGFSDLKITIRGFGTHFDNEVRVIRDYPNVTVEKTYSGNAEMAMLHYDHGIFLCPSRYDTQGVMLGEAMASGMVTITNPVAAIPEFTDATCSLMPRPDDPIAFAEAIWHAVENPGIMPVLSSNAAARVERQCGVAATVEREIEIVRSLGA